MSLNAQNPLVYGTITNTDAEPIPNVSVSFQKYGTTTDINGFYTLELPELIGYELTFSHVSYKSITKKITLKKGEHKALSLIMESNVETIDEITIEGQKDPNKKVSQIDVEAVKNISSANPGIESTLKITGLGASSDNELSTQYRVRGGNYDENLVYVNGIEVYRPFLVRSGQQEGLSFLNPELVSSVNFSSGGFQAAYGDKLSSVLDITYRRPQDFGLKAAMSLLGAELTYEDINRSKTRSAIVGMRYRNNALLVKTQDVESNYKPRFADIQTYITQKLNDQFLLSFLGNFALNDYRYEPNTRSTKFGTLQDPKELIVYYEGQEQDRYQTLFGALSLDYFSPNYWKWTMTSSVFNTQEEEFYDVNAQYYLGQPDTDAGTENYGETEFIEGIGSQINHARNELDALIGQLSLKTSTFKGDNHWNFGLEYQIENIKDRLKEWEMIYSAGYALRPPRVSDNNQPYEPYEGPIIPYQNVRSFNDEIIQRFSGFAQWRRQFTIDEHQLWVTAGLRSHYWMIKDNGENLISPRVQLAFKPDWEKDMIFRLSGGRYVQPPFYRELRDLNGQINYNVKAQDSYHFVLGYDYGFKMWDRPFKWVTEVYYKNMFNVNPYTVDNVRIRYAAENIAKAYAYGVDMRLNGEFVPGAESWVNVSYLKTEENIDGQGWLARPTDQRLKFALLFQDYVPSIPNLKMSLNLVYNTGVPGGSPTYADPYDYQLRLGDYKRADLGIYYMIKDAQNEPNSAFYQRFKEFSIGGEILNIFDMNNAITNTWVRDIYSPIGQKYGVKNYMTGRVFNVKVKMAF